MILVKSLRFWRRSAPLAERHDFDDQGVISLGQSNDIAHAHGNTGFFSVLSLAMAGDARAALNHSFPGQAPRFEKPRVPEPAIKALGFRRFIHQ